MNRLFNTFFDAPAAGGGGGQVRRWVPAMDLVETDDHFVLQADLPGLDEGDVAIELHENVLTVSGERRYEHEGKKDGFYRLERGSGRFERSLTPSAPAWPARPGGRRARAGPPRPRACRGRAARGAGSGGCRDEPSGWCRRRSGRRAE